MAENSVEKNNENLGKTLSNNWLVIIIAMVLGGIISACYLSLYIMYLGRGFGGPFMFLIPLLFLPGAFISGLLAIFAFNLIGGRNKGVLIGSIIIFIIAIIPIVLITLIWMGP